MVSQFANSSGAATNSLTGVGNLNSQLSAQLPAAAKPLIPRITTGIQADLSESIAGLMWLGAGSALAAFLLFLRMPELPLRRTTTAEEEAKRGVPAVAVA